MLTTSDIASCAYSHYDIDTLRTTNLDSLIRIAELGWTKADFEGRTVLDIGTNSGLLSITAHRLGAKSVDAIDVNPAYVDFLRSVSEKHDLPIMASVRAFNTLSPEDDVHDVVLFMEVLHWAVSQGIPMREVLQKLARITRDTLYIEFPWSVDEPSIKAQTALTEKTYNAQTVLEELTRYFSNVRIVRFMKYMGHKSPSVRVLIKADGRRPAAEAIMEFSNANVLSVPMIAGRSASTLINTENGVVITKTIPSYSPLNSLSQQDARDLFDDWQQSSPAIVLLPKKIGDHYIVRNNIGQSIMAFPFIEGESDLAQGYKHLDAPALVDVAHKLYLDFRDVSLRHFSLLLAKGFDSTAASALLRLENNLGAPFISENARSEIYNLTSTVNSNLSNLDCICHFDLHPANVIWSKGKAAVVDLDNMALGTGYTDGLIALIRVGCTLEHIASLEARISSHYNRRIEKPDVLLAVAATLDWHNASTQQGGTLSQGALKRLSDGVSSALKYPTAR